MEVGSFFEYPDFDSKKLEDSAHYALTSGFSKKKLGYSFIRDGRQAIKAILLRLHSRIGSETCYLPSYLCESIFQPFEELGLRVEYYHHKAPLKPVIDFGPKNSLIFILDYFGSEAISNREVKDLANDGNVVIVDITHSLFNPNRFKLIDPDVYLIASLRKIFPIPDGGIIYHNDASFVSELSEPKGLDAILQAMFLKKFYLQNKDHDLQQVLKEDFLRLYRNYESSKDGKIKVLEKMPDISVHILQKLAISSIIDKRSQNLAFLEEGIRDEFLLFNSKDLKSPFCAPIVFESESRREKSRLELIKHCVFPPVHWQLPKSVPTTFGYEHKLSQRILSIPIDQRYTEKDLELVHAALPEIFNRQ